ncbi:hypothetical protein TH19_03485 [Thalassospira profundimaris]|uniref:Glycosyl transferase family 1 domain-containing protein n=1 Tax=Thalassospira profundimaris TaxID=502049 RepID=A0A367WBP1_9PROT|nr:hypothetical protein TH19_03485 [Thalassospira profundimaris]
MKGGSIPRDEGCFLWELVDLSAGLKFYRKFKIVKKIFYLSESIFPSKSANSVHVMKMCGAFVRQGFDVELFGYKGNADLGEVKDFYNVKSSFKIFLFSTADIFVNRLLIFCRRWVPGFRYGSIPNFLTGVRVVSEMKLGCDDVCYGRNLFWLCEFARRYPNNQFVLEVHRPPSGVLELLCLKYLVSRKGFKSCVVISSKLKALMLDQCSFLRGGSVQVLHDGADETGWLFGQHRERLGAFKVGYVGHLYKGRGVQEVLIHVARELSEVEFHIVGGTPDDLSVVLKRGIPANMIIHGFKRQAELPKLMECFDAVVAPYQDVTTVNNEGNTSPFMSPLKIFEYMAAQKAIVVSDLPVLHEVVTHNKECLFVNPENVSEWVEAIKKLIFDDDMRRDLGVNARKRLVSQYSWDVRAGHISRLYEYNS